MLWQAMSFVINGIVVMMYVLSFALMSTFSKKIIFPKEKIDQVSRFNLWFAKGSLISCSRRGTSKVLMAPLYFALLLTNAWLSRILTIDSGIQNSSREKHALSHLQIWKSFFGLRGMRLMMIDEYCHFFSPKLHQMPISAGKWEWCWIMPL